MEYANHVHKTVTCVNHLFTVISVFRVSILINLLVFVIKIVVLNYLLTLMDFARNARKDVSHVSTKILVIFVNLDIYYLINNALFLVHKNTLHLICLVLLVEKIVIIVKMKIIVLNVHQIITY
jgi:hypothetical protein